MFMNKREFMVKNLKIMLFAGAAIAFIAGASVMFFLYKKGAHTDSTGSLTLSGRLSYSLSKEQQCELIKNHKMGNDLMPVLEGLNRFFSDPLVQKIFVQRYKTPIVAPIVSAGSRMTPEKKALLQENEKNYKIAFKKIEIPSPDVISILRGLMARYMLKLYPSNSVVLASPLWDEHVIKIAKHRWIDNHEMVAFPYQLVSRIFYNKKIRGFINKEKLTHVMVPLKYLYHIPGTPEELHDDNYIIVEEKIEQVHDQKTVTVLKQVVSAEALVVLEKLKDLWRSGDDRQTVKLIDQLEKKLNLPQSIIELIRVIRFAGLWSMGGHGKLNIGLLSDGKFFINDARMAVLDTERPGLGGGLSRWENFFHKDEIEIIKLAGCGLEEFINLIKN